MVVVSVGYGFVLLGTSLGKALGSTLDTSADDKITIVMLVAILILGVVTGVGSFKLKFKGWRIVYIGGFSSKLFIVERQALIDFFGESSIRSNNA